MALEMEPAAEWVPSSETFGSCYQTSVPASSTGGQAIEYAAATQEDPVVKVAHEFQVDFHNMERKIQNPIQAFERAAHEFRVDIDNIEMKIHRYPPSIRALNRWYTTPTMVAIGPYHHGREHLKPVEQLKHVAAYHCIRELAGHSSQEMYDEVVSVAYHARSLYDKEVMAGMSDNDFLPMMFYDACFLVQYMLTFTTGQGQMDPALRNFFDSNDNDIFHDLMLLENQLPWRVVEAVMRFRPVPLDVLIDSLRARLQDRRHKDSYRGEFVLDGSYETQHFLGLLRYYIAGRSKTSIPKRPQTDSISFSISAIELSEMGIDLRAKKTTPLIHMGVKKNGPLFAHLFLTPLSLDEARASWLINMAALELCTIPNFQAAEDEASAICSYLLLFAIAATRPAATHIDGHRRRCRTAVTVAASGGDQWQPFA